jgi:hypothetical protein
MRDLIWTVITLWVVWKLYDAFKHVLKPQQAKNTGSFKSKKAGEVKIENMRSKQKPNFNANNAEYVDYEEVK